MNSKSKKIMIACFTLPATLCFLIVFAYPVLRTILMSFYNIDNIVSRMSEWQFVGLGIFTELLNTSLFRQTWVTFLKIWLFGGIAVTLIALTMAVILTSGIRGKAFFRAAIYLPNIISAVALANMWIHYAFNVRWGLFHSLFSFLGWDKMAEFQWTAPDNLFLSMMIAFCFGAVGYYMLIYISGIEKIPADIYEAARIDGATEWEVFRKIKWPLLRPITSFIIMMGIINSFKVFAEINVMMPPKGPTSSTLLAVVYIYEQAFSRGRFGRGSAAALLLFLVIIVLTMVQRRLGGKKTVDID